MFMQRVNVHRAVVSEDRVRLSVGSGRSHPSRCSRPHVLFQMQHTACSRDGCAVATNNGYAGCDGDRGQDAFRYTVRRHKCVTYDRRAKLPSQPEYIWRMAEREYVQNA